MAHESRCIVCGCPAIDHAPIKYWFKAWFKHGVIHTAGRLLGRIHDTSIDW